MREQDDLKFGDLTWTCVHLCVDMQRMFAEATEWRTPWMPRVVPKVRQIAEWRPAQTIFTRFIPADRPGDGKGAWRRYYERWRDMTIERLGRDMIDLVPELASFAPPACVVDKRVYSPWLDEELHRILGARGADAIVISGGETDVCVLSTVLGAVDRGYRVVIATDALCSSSDETHEAMLTLYRNRYGQQVETASVEAILRRWP